MFNTSSNYLNLKLSLTVIGCARGAKKMNLENGYSNDVENIDRFNVNIAEPVVSNFKIGLLDKK